VTVRLVALHGFLGRASDWDGLAARLPGVDVRAVDLWHLLADSADWRSATKKASELFFGEVAKVADSETSGAASSAIFVVGYSLGARLALGSLNASLDSRIRGCCFVSCNPGLPDHDVAGREARRASDARWASRIADEPEGAFWAAWDAQPVFDGSASAPRGPLPAPRQVLARVLTACSLAGQPDLRPQLRAWPGSVLWVTGARDVRFSAIAQELHEARVPAEFAACPTAGHRVPWDDPDWFAEALRGWMARLT